MTLDPDVETMLREEMHRSRRSFKQTLNAAVRGGLSRTTKVAAGKRFKVKARAMGLRADIDPARLNQLADQLEVDAFIAGTKRSKR